MSCDSPRRTRPTPTRRHAAAIAHVYEPRMHSERSWGRARACRPRSDGASQRQLSISRHRPTARRTARRKQRLGLTRPTAVHCRRRLPNMVLETNTERRVPKDVSAALKERWRSRAASLRRRGAALAAYGLDRRDVSGSFLAVLAPVDPTRRNRSMSRLDALNVSTASDATSHGLTAISRRSRRRPFAPVAREDRDVVTVKLSRAESYAFWRNPTNLPASSSCRKRRTGERPKLRIGAFAARRHNHRVGRRHHQRHSRRAARVEVGWRR